MKKQLWTKSMLDALRTHYPHITTAEAAEIIGVSETSAKRKAKELGLKKAIKRSKIKKFVILRENFNRSSFAELAQMIGTSKSTVARMAERVGLSRTQAENSSIRSRVRREISRRDRLRIRVGLAPLTRLIERN